MRRSYLSCIIPRCIIVALASVILSTFVDSSLAIGPTPPTWEPREFIDQVSTNAHDGADRVLAYDHLGNAAVAYVLEPDFSENTLVWYGQREAGVGWNTGPLSAGFVPRTKNLAYPSLSFDRSERPHVTYHNSTDNVLRYEHWDGVAWQGEDAADGGAFSALAFDHLGRPAVAYQNDTGDLAFLQDTDGDFSFLDESSTVLRSSQFDDSVYSSLAFDQQNRPGVSASHDGAFPNISYYTTGGPAGLAVSDVTFGTYSSIAIDPDTGVAAIAGITTFGSLVLAEWDGSFWNTTTIDSQALYPSLAFDPADGNPAIAYFSDDEQALKLAWHDGTMWQTQTVDSGPGVGLHPSLAFNDFGDGFPSISYIVDDPQLLGAELYFIHDPPATVPEPAGIAIGGLGALACLVLARRRRRQA